VNKDQLKGRTAQVVGKVKEVTGRVVGNRTLEEKGRIEEVTGKVRAGYGDVRDQADKKRPR